MTRRRQLGLALGLSGLGVACALGVPLVNQVTPSSAAGLSADEGRAAPRLLRERPHRSYPRIARSPVNPFQPPAAALDSAPPGQQSELPADIVEAVAPPVLPAAQSAPSRAPQVPAAPARPPASGDVSPRADPARVALKSEVQGQTLPHVQLKGVIRGEPNAALVLLDRQPHLVREGDSVGPWTVLRITDISIILARGERQQELQLEGTSAP